MLTIDVAEARDRLPELLALVAAGTKVTITDGDQPVAVLSHAPRMPTPEEETEAERAAENGIRSLIQMWRESGYELPSDSPLQRFTEAGARS